MKHIIKVNNILEAKDNPIRPIIALDDSGVLFAEGLAPKPQIEFVDLGLSVKWAKYNYGVNPNQLTKASDWYGKYLMWGELEEKSGWDGQGAKVTYDWHNYKYANGSIGTLTKYCNTSSWGDNGFTDNLTQLVPEDDVVAVNYGGNWRMPTNEDFEELLAGTTNSWVENYNNVEGLNGRVFTSKVNGNTLFIPVAGYRRSSDNYYVGSTCSVWSSSLYLENKPYYAYYLHFNSDEIYTHSNDRRYGFSVRAIC